MSSLRRLRRASSFVFASCLVAIAACGGPSTGSTAGSGGTGAGGPSTSTSSGQGGEGGLIVGEGGSGGAGCAAEKLQATLTKRPVDVILIVDTSPSMMPASDAVEDNINVSLAAVLGASGLDYRVIVLAGYGSGAELCISPPLGGAACEPNPPAKPATTATFYHYVKSTGSGEFLSNILLWYNAPDDSGLSPNGWSALVRPDAAKVFLAFSDTSSSSTLDGATFDSKLLALQPAVFGTAAKRDYVFHTIGGLGENNPATAPWLPGDPIVNSTCSGYNGGLGPGEPWQAVSVLSGGWRFPLCQFGAFDVVFKQIAANVVEQTKLACTFPLPEPPAGKTIDPDTIQLDYTPGGGGAKQQMSQVVGLNDCKAGAFYVDGSTIHLCPEACAVVEADTSGSIDVLYGCDTGFAK